MGRCCVVGCTSGYKSNLEKVSRFAAPRDPELRKKWSNALPRLNYTVNDRSYLCEKHFAPEEIIRYWESGTESTNRASETVWYIMCVDMLPEKY